LALHTSEESCASCHVKIDPPGFALENFDPTGQWRDHYPRIEQGRNRKGAEIDPAHTLPDGRSFASVGEFQQLVSAHPEQLAQNVAAKLLTYGTGAPVGFADRPGLATIVTRTAETNYGFHSLLVSVVSSDIFQRK
jgi:hypothetical protein